MTGQLESVTIGIRKKKTVNVGDVFTSRDGRWQRKVLSCCKIDGYFYVVYSQDLIRDELGFEGEHLCSVETLFAWGFKTASSPE